MLVSFHFSSSARSVTPNRNLSMISQAPLKAVWYSWNSTFIWLALPDPWLQFGRVVSYLNLPSKLCCTHATQLSFISLSQICDSYLGALSDIQSPPSLPQSNSFLAAFRFSLQPFLLSLFFFPMSTSFPALRSLLSPLSTLHCLRPSRSSYPVLCPRLLCPTTSLVILAFVPPFSGIGYHH